MQDATVGSQDTPTAGYSLQEAATLLGIGVNTLRRRIAAGQVKAAQVERPQGYVWRVYLDDRHSPNDPPSNPPNQEAPRSLPHPPAAAPAAEAMVSLIQTTIGTILGPLVAELAASRQANERSQDRVAELERENGRLAAELAAARVQNTPLDASGSTESPDPTLEPPGPFPEPFRSSPVDTRPWWRRWRMWLTAGAVLVVVGSASCQAAGSLREGPNVCAAARQHIRVFNEQVVDGREANPEGVWLAAGEQSVWPEITTVAAFIKNHC
jgi:hypothetical protein